MFISHKVSKLRKSDSVGHPSEGDPFPLYVLPYAPDEGPELPDGAGADEAGADEAGADPAGQVEADVGAAEEGAVAAADEELGGVIVTLTKVMGAAEDRRPGLGESPAIAFAGAMAHCPPP